MQNFSPAELLVVRYYLANLYTLEAAVPGSGANLDTAQASVCTHNPKEVSDRRDLFDDWRRWLCQFMGVPPWGELSNPNGWGRVC